jgi:multicomponent Na+:H+ antiporter subunit G
MAAWLPWLVDALVVGSLAVMTLSVWGIVRRPAFGVRIHAAAKAVFLGLMPLLLAAALAGDGSARARAALVAIFLVLTTPVSSHALARAAWRGERPAEDVEAASR